MSAESFAYEVQPRGCTCGNNGGGDCEWCLAYASDTGRYEDKKTGRVVCVRCGAHMDVNQHQCSNFFCTNEEPDRA